MNESDRINYNKELIEKYPFLMPRNLWTGLPISDYDYLYTLADNIPLGWRAAFGDMLIDEINNDLVKHEYVDKYMILQIKEKYGELRWYDNGVPDGSEIWSIIDKYTHISRNTCITCGKPDVPMLLLSWISPYCEGCYERMPNTYEGYYNKLIDHNGSSVIPDSYTTIHYSSDGNRTVTTDISKTVKLIRKRWEDGTITERYNYLKGLQRVNE